MSFLNISGEAEIHTVPKIKHRDFPYSSLPRRFRDGEKPCNSQYLGMYRFPQNGNILRKATS